MSKKVKISIVTIFILTLILSSVLYFFMNTSKDKHNIIWPKVNENNLSMSIKGYDGKYDKGEFQKTFEKEIDDSLLKQGFEKEKIDYTFGWEDNKVDVKVKVEDKEKNYSFDLINNFMGII